MKTGKSEPFGEPHDLIFFVDVDNNFKEFAINRVLQKNLPRSFYTHFVESLRKINGA